MLKAPGMNKAQLIARIAADSGVSKTKTGLALDSLTRTIMQLLENGQKINLAGLGIFSVSWHRARTGRHPQTGVPLRIKTKRRVRFKTSFELSDALNDFPAKHLRFEQGIFTKEMIQKQSLSTV